MSLCFLASTLIAGMAPPAQKPPAAATSQAAGGRSFSNPQAAADALVEAASKFDFDAIVQIFGVENKDLIASGEPAQDRQRAADFVAAAREKKSISIDPKTPNRAFVLIGKDNWPFPIPLVKRGSSWFFDTTAGRQEILYRRVGANELDAIQICLGYVEAQHEYALKKRVGYDVNQYAQRIVSTPGTQDGLAWQNSDGTWGGPVGEKIAQAIERGYTSRSEPYHGYFFKVLKGQGPAAPLGEMDYMIKGVMIGGFALVASPAEYEVTGIKTFIVSQDGIVYEKDLGPTTSEQFKSMDRFNPDKSWVPVSEKDE